MAVDELASYLHERRKEKGYLFIPYLLLGDPSYEQSLEIADKLLSLGADSLELGLPFSDPAADGVVLQRAFRRVLAQGFHWQDVLVFLRKLRARYPQRYFLVMGYANLLYQHGFLRLFEELYSLGVRGVVVPDIPLEEKERIRRSYGLGSYRDKVAWIDFVTPTTTPERLNKILMQARGFLYIVSYKGTTGSRNVSFDEVRKALKGLRAMTKLPLIVGFGIRQREHIVGLLPYADGFIIGSRIHEIIEENISRQGDLVAKIGEEISQILPPKELLSV